MLSGFALPLALLPLTLAVDHPITVGAGAQLRFVPNNIKAAPGDTLSFSYFPKNHSVTASNFAVPCVPLPGGFNSGFQPLAAGPGPLEFVVTVNDSKPIWIYCAQTKGSHCQMGMSMVVNEPVGPNSLAAYQAKAALSGNSTAAPIIAGGIFVSKNGTGATATATPTAPSATFAPIKDPEEGTEVGSGARLYPDAQRDGYNNTGSGSKVGSGAANHVPVNFGDGHDADAGTKVSGSTGSSSGSSPSSPSPSTGTSTGFSSSETSPIALTGAATNLASGSAVALISSLVVALGFVSL